MAWVKSLGQMWSPSLLGNLSCRVQLVGIALDALRNVCLGAPCTFLVPRRMVPPHDMLCFLEKGSGFFHDSTGTSFCQRNFPVFSSFGCPALQTAPGSECDNQLYPDKGQFAVHDLLAWMTGAASVKDPKLPQNENSRSGLNGSPFM